MEKNKFTTMRITQETKKRMRKFEQHPREIDEDVLLHILDDVEKIYGENKNET